MVVYFKTRVSPYHTEYTFMWYILKGNLLYILLPPEQNLRSLHGRLLNSIPKEKLALGSKLLRSLKAQPYIQTIQCSGSITQHNLLCTGLHYVPYLPFSSLQYRVHIACIWADFHVMRMSAWLWPYSLAKWQVSVYCSRLRSNICHYSPPDIYPFERVMFVATKPFF